MIRYLIYKYHKSDPIFENYHEKSTVFPVFIESDISEVKHKKKENQEFFNSLSIMLM